MSNLSLLTKTVTFDRQPTFPLYYTHIRNALRVQTCPLPRIWQSRRNPCRCFCIVCGDCSLRTVSSQSTRTPVAESTCWLIPDLWNQVLQLKVARPWLIQPDASFRQTGVIHVNRLGERLHSTRQPLPVSKIPQMAKIRSKNSQKDNPHSKNSVNHISAKVWCFWVVTACIYFFLRKS